MKRTYASPALVEYGQALSLTLGGGTPATDSEFSLSSGFITNPSNNTCVPPKVYLGCYPTAGPGSPTNPIP